MKVLSENSDGFIEVLDPAPFGLEVRLQELLEEHPGLVLADLPSDQDRAIWTIGWEVTTAAGTIDLLMLDSTGRVWVVETKLAANNEVKKQVVGQVLAYTAAVAEWDTKQLSAVANQYLTQRANTGHADLFEYLADQIGDDQSAQTLIDDAGNRLARGDLTALIVVDEIPKQLRRLVEFVNSHATFELLALKVEVLPHGNSQLFIPTVVGAIAQSDQQQRQSRNWDRDSIVGEIARDDPAAAAIARELIDWAIEQPILEPWFGTGAVTGSFIPTVRLGPDDWVPLFGIYTSHRIMPTWRYRKAHQQDPYWLPMVREFTEIGGEEQQLERAKAFPLDVLIDETRLTRFKEVTLSTAEAAKQHGDP